MVAIPCLCSVFGFSQFLAFLDAIHFCKIVWYHLAWNHFSISFLLILFIQAFVVICISYIVLIWFGLFFLWGFVHILDCSEFLVTGLFSDALAFLPMMYNFSRDSMLFAMTSWIMSYFMLGVLHSFHVKCVID